VHLVGFVLPPFCQGGRDRGVILGQEVLHRREWEREIRMYAKRLKSTRGSSNR
jgi:hypothetical protein